MLLRMLLWQACNGSPPTRIENGYSTDTTDSSNPDRDAIDTIIAPPKAKSRLTQYSHTSSISVLSEWPFTNQRLQWETKSLDMPLNFDN